jgi:seryl-tRNA synthetase
MYNRNSVSVVHGLSCESWPETRQLMGDLLQLFEKQKQSPIMLAFQECIHLQSKLEQKRDLLLTQSTEIKNRIESVTDQCSQLLKEETDKLKIHERNLEELQTEIDRVMCKRNDLQQQLSQVNQQIETYSMEASQEIDGFDTVEMEKRDEVPRLKQQISMHAAATGIKWDYDRTDVLAGEVSIPSKKVLKRFCIDLDEKSNFEVANKVWDIIDTTS